MTPALLQALQQGAPLLTANTRLLREYSTRYDEAMSQQAEAWSTAKIRTWNGWLEECWHRSCPAQLAAGESIPLLLTGRQELSVWEQVIEDDLDQETQLLQIPATAKAASEAWALRHAWRLPDNSPAYIGIEEAQAFRRWARAYEQRCHEEGWVDQAVLTDLVREAFENEWLEAPESLFLAGFLEWTPQQKQLLDQLQECGSTLESLSPNEAGHSYLTLAEDVTDELRKAATWARSLWEQDHSGRIGIVVPDLTGIRDQAERIFEDVLHPSAGLDAMRPAARSFHLSLGPALSDHPVISAALLLLELGKRQMPLARLTALLSSPYWHGAAAERSARALLDAEIRRQGYGEVTRKQLLDFASRTRVSSPEPCPCPTLVTTITGIDELLAGTADRQPLARWSELFSAILELAGWPGERVLDSREYQTVQRWQTTLAELASLGRVMPACRYVDALAMLNRLASECPFEVENEGAPIQVMSFVEALGVTFDHLWVMGLHDGVWPPPARPNPFLPIALQREHCVPHCDANRELDDCRKATEWLGCSAPEVLFSAPRCEGDRELRPSPLIADLPDWGEPLPVAETVVARIRESWRNWVPEPDLLPPALPAGIVQPGGVGVFEKQAACPFRAFAEYRLGARALEEIGIGLSPQERGTVLHLALQLVWQTLGTHEALIGEPEPSLRVLIQDSVSKALDRGIQQRGAAAWVRLQELEQQRLERLLDLWLDIEKRRAPFRVLDSELKRLVTIGGVQIDVQIDRVDELADGRHVLIDYKTNEPRTKDWEGERPDAPQLPLYTVTHPAPVAAVSFGVLKTGKLAFRGLAEQGDLLPNVSAYDPAKAGAPDGTQFDDHLQQWRHQLERLGEAFRCGTPHVDPKDAGQTCRWCRVGPLCRVSDVTAVMDEGTDE